MTTHCDRLVDSGRRKFLTGASIAAAGAAASAVMAPQAKAAPAAARVDYPSNRLGNLRDLKTDAAVERRLSGRRRSGRAASSSASAFHPGPAPTATSSDFPPSVRTKDSHSPMTGAIGR